MLSGLHGKLVGEPPMMPLQEKAGQDVWKALAAIFPVVSAQRQIELPLFPNAIGIQLLVTNSIVLVARLNLFQHGVERMVWVISLPSPRPRLDVAGEQDLEGIRHEEVREPALADHPVGRSLVLDPLVDPEVVLRVFEAEAAEIVHVHAEIAPTFAEQLAAGKPAVGLPLEDFLHGFQERGAPDTGLCCDRDLVLEWQVRLPRCRSGNYSITSFLELEFLKLGDHFSSRS